MVNIKVGKKLQTPEPQGQEDISTLTIAYGSAANQLAPLASAMLAAYVMWQMNQTEANYQAWQAAVNALAAQQAAVDAAWAALAAAIQEQGG